MGDIETLRRFASRRNALGYDGDITDALSRVLAVATVPEIVVDIARRMSKVVMDPATRAEAEAWVAAVAALRTPPETVRKCDYWKPILPGAIALPCSCGMGCDGPRSAAPAVRL